MKNIRKTFICLSLGLMLEIGAQAQKIVTQTAGYNSMRTLDTGSTIVTPSPSRHSPHVYTNDDLAFFAEERATKAPKPLSAKTSGIGGSEASATTQAATSGTQGNKEAVESLKKQADDLKLQTALLQREIDMDEREMKLRHAYGSSSMLWSSNGDFAVESQKLHDGLQEKNRKLADMRRSLQSLKESAQKSGIQLD